MPPYENHLLFSIVIPVYNVCAIEHKFRRCVESVRAQTFRDWELILVNDTSTDTTADILQSLAATDKRIRILSNMENMRHGISRNTGTNAADGDYIVYCDHDDCIFPHALQNAASVIGAHDDLDVIQFRYVGVDDAEAEKFLSIPINFKHWWKRSSIVHRGDAILSRFLYGRLTLVSWARAIRVDLARRIKFVDTRPEDVPHSLELFAQADVVVEVRHICHVQIIRNFNDIDLRRGFFDGVSTWHNFNSHLLSVYRIAQRMPAGHRVFCVRWALYSIFLLDHFNHGDEEIFAWGRMVDSMNISLFIGAAHCLWRDMRRGCFSDGIKQFMKIRRYYCAYQHLRSADFLKESTTDKSATDSSSSAPDGLQFAQEESRPR